MNRLFWKFFFAFWLALGVMLAGLFVARSLYDEAQEAQASSIEQGGRAEFALRQLGSVIRNVNVDDLRKILNDRPDHSMPAPMVVSEAGVDLLGRPVSPSMLDEARILLRETPANAAVRRVMSHDGQSYLIFQPARTDKRNEIPRPPRGMIVPVALLVAALIACLGVSTLLARHFSRPIQNLRDAFQSVAEGKLDTRIGGSMGRRQDEIAELGAEFDKMTERLEQSVAAQKRLLHDVSHELRSPLARQQVAIELARQQPGKMAAALDRIEQESGRLDALVGEILTLARLESGVPLPVDEYVDLVELFDTVIEDARFEASQSGRQIEARGPDASQPLILRARGELLHRALENIVRNAISHTPADSAVQVVCQRSAESLSITVTDHGTGVPAGELETIFEPFYRSENGSTGGFGLGLAIARRAVEFHGGQILARNGANGGLEIELILPLTEVVTLSASV